MSSACLAHAGNQAHEPRRRDTPARARAQAPARYAQNRDPLRSRGGSETGSRGTTHAEDRQMPEPQGIPRTPAQIDGVMPE